ncbi:MAG: MFS transporter [Chlorobi bacterium]|nr:MFS transporter [Chlorobiota bacterium]
MPKSNDYINLRSNRTRFVLQGFFLATALAVADTSTVLPLIVDYFGGGKVLVGVLSSLMKSGAVVMQLWTAFKAQEHSLVLGSLRKVFVFRFLSWFFIGLSILLFAGGGNYLILILISVFLFMFSFFAGMGVIYYQEILGKSFTKEYRGKAISYKQISAGIAGILSGGISGFILERFSKPQSFSYLFLVSSFLMAAGFLIFWNFKETEKNETVKREQSFILFLKHAVKLFREDKDLRVQVFARFISYALFLILPFIILKAKNDFGITGKSVGLIITVQMTGAVFGNFLWGVLSSKNKNKSIVLISFVLSIFAVSLTFFADDFAYYYIVYFLIGAAIDGFRLAFSNLILIIAPADKRPMYIAVQNNLSSLGLFFPILGGVIFKTFSYNVLSVFTLVLLFAGLVIGIFLKKE